MGKRLRVAIAGGHRMLTRQPGSHNWAAAFAAVPEAEIVAVFDLGAETRNTFMDCWSEAGTAITAYADYESMLHQAQPDIVCVATRQTMHAGQIEQAVAAGVRGILSDKPLATTLAEVDRILTACRGAAVPLAFGLDRRWMTRYDWARRQVEEGAIGRVTAVMAYGLPNLVNHGCHWYDAALALAGDPEVSWVSGLVDDTSQEPPGSRRVLDPPGRAQVGLANGVTVYVTPDGLPGPTFEVLGHRGRLLLLDDARDAYLWRVEGASGAQPHPVQVPVTLTPWEAGPKLVADLVAAVHSGGPTACDVAEARRASAIGFAIHASSAAGGRRLALDEVDRELRVPSFPWGND
ncbi:MAG: Gfo/Idh/MocA family oxidoreductase [Chloroflexota bacterium]|nr:Gfo/Idh/MocA family oxidoreductase [Chloroflexota bacterium]